MGEVGSLGRARPLKEIHDLLTVVALLHCFMAAELFWDLKRHSSMVMHHCSLASVSLPA